MQPIYIALQTCAILESLNSMKTMDDMHIPVFLEDIRAQMDAMGLTLEEVVKAGLYSLGDVSAETGRRADESYYPRAYIGTATWRDRIDEILDWWSESLAWNTRTFLKTLLTQDNISPQELCRANSIIEALYERRSSEDGIGDDAAETAPPPPRNQYGLDI